MSDDKKLPALRGTSWQDVAAALGKGTLGAIPFAGSILAEVAGLVIPNQRLDRIEAYLRLLGERLDGQDLDALGEQLRDPESIELFEEGAVQSLRAVSDERKAYIASAVSEGLSGDAKDRIQARRLLKLLAQVDDDQIIILASHLNKHNWDDGFIEKHKAILAPTSAHLGSDQESLDAAAMFALARAELVRLGLLRPYFKKLKKGEVPEFDDSTGLMKASGLQLTALGRLLLRQIGLAASGEG